MGLFGEPPIVVCFSVDPLDERFGPGEEAPARAAARAIVEGPTLERFLYEPRGDLLVGVSDREVRDWLGAETQAVRLSEDLMRKQKGQWQKKTKAGRRQYEGHRLTAAEYRLLPRLIEQPQVVMRYMPARRIAPERLALRLNLLSRVRGAYYNSVLGRAPGDAGRVRLISFYSLGADRAYVERMIAQAASGEDGQAVFRNLLASPAGGGTAPGSPVGPPGGLPKPAARPKPSP